MTAVGEGWPEAVRQEVGAQWQSASVAIPMSRIEPALKAGHVVFTWGDLIAWLTPPLSAPSANQETPLELPLKVIAPLFMSRRRPGAVQKKVAIDANIPDVFGALAAQAEAVSSAPATTPQPVAAPPAPAKAPDPLGEIFGQPAKSEWSPQEIAAAVRGLNGVTGSLVTMSDGLLVAGQVPSPLKTETVAAFIPQMFGRMTHYSGEMQMGAITTLSMMAGGTPLVIYKAGNLFLAVIGKAGEALPETVLQRIAVELSKRS
ncbi:MAG TPA: roadblock/LC7 domain-containing protein [Candidatus Saccharimonadales bacterium]|nr:roadblock/LC7 domain-containing protein [Candidatus Saccharimonadales bacterium]